MCNLFISTNNEPKKEGQYGKLAGMGEIMSIVDFINKNEKWSKLVSQEVEKLADEIFKVDPKIVHVGLIDLEGHILLDQSAAASKPTEPDTDRIMFYYQTK